MFASPKPMLVGAPLLLLPILVVFLMQNAPTPSPIELAIAQLPIAGGSSGGGGNAAPSSPLGDDGGALPASVSLPLYANSARPDATPESLHDDDEADRNIEITQYTVLHPQSLEQQDLLIGQVALLYETPFNEDLSNKLLQEYCTAKPSDPFYNVSLLYLPIDPVLRDALVRLGGADSASCPRLN